MLGEVQLYAAAMQQDHLLQFCAIRPATCNDSTASGILSTTYKPRVAEGMEGQHVKP